MYRLVAVVLLILSGIAILLSIFNLAPYSFEKLALSCVVVVVATDLFGRIFARLFHTSFNWESNLITGLLLFLILEPSNGGVGLIKIALVSLVAVASKYLITNSKRHLFNPAAFALFIAPLAFGVVGFWWIGNPYMLIPTLIASLLIVRKVRRFELFGVTILSNLISLFVFNFSHVGFSWSLINTAMISGPIIFFAAFMVTEPQTLPPFKKQQLVYGAIAGFFSSVPWGVWGVGTSPESALLLANLFAFIVGFKRKVELKLVSKTEIAKNIYEFIFSPNIKIHFYPGQYLEWILPHANPDSRGQRRFFTIASSPTENTLNLGIKFYDKPSTFKQSLLNLKPGDNMLAGQLGGDFTLYEKSNRPIVFLSGGIGVTPFRSMIKKLLDTRDTRPVKHFYMVKSSDEFAYVDLFEEARTQVGVQTYFVTSAFSDGDNKAGYLRRDFSSELLKDYGVDFVNSVFYISGPSAMVDAYKKILKESGARKIKTDYFPGF
jgi:ferredoxin-NADP reductase/Na+-translocating ferredoxin:NAD+ oxidoreductase RnfD subunit